MTTAFVSGATGFIAQHLIKLLLSKNFKVVGSVRTESKGHHLKTLFNNPNFTYVVVPDLVKPGAFDEALKANPDINVFFHTASPVFIVESDFKNLIINPAVEGTKNALKAAHKYGKNITKFVLTSSGAAIAYESPVKTTINEETWTQIPLEIAVTGPFPAYIASKTYGEQAAWRFIEEQSPQFSLVTVLPTLVTGPQAFDSEAKGTLNYSAEIFNKFLKLKPSDPLPDSKGQYVDVRDVAQAHLIAYERKEAAGKRLFLQNGNFDAQRIANILHDNFPQLKDTVPVGNPSEVGPLSNPLIDNSKTLKILDYEPISFEESVVDAATQILRNN